MKIVVDFNCVLYCLSDTDLRFSLFIWPAARVRCNDKMVRLGVWYIPTLFGDVQGHALASAQNAEYKAPTSLMLHAIQRLLTGPYLLRGYRGCSLGRQLDRGGTQCTIRKKKVKKENNTGVWQTSTCKNMSQPPFSCQDDSQPYHVHSVLWLHGLTFYPHSVSFFCFSLLFFAKNEN